MQWVGVSSSLIKKNNSKDLYILYDTLTYVILLESYKSQWDNYAPILDEEIEDSSQLKITQVH